MTQFYGMSSFPLIAMIDNVKLWQYFYCESAIQEPFCTKLHAFHIFPTVTEATSSIEIKTKWQNELLKATFKRWKLSIFKGIRKLLRSLNLANL